MGDLASLFAPDRVAVVGATDREGSVGRAVTANLLDTFEGEVVAVNPDRDEVLGLSCVDSVAAAAPVDVAVVAVPPSVAVEVTRQAGEAGVENLVVITAGFGEAGSEGMSRERELVDLAEEYGLNLVGPNSLGILSTSVGLNATFGPSGAQPGNISFMSQSGAFVTAVLDWAGDRDLGFKDVVSLGNKAVLDESDFVREWGDDPETDVVLGYLEDVSEGRRFVEVAAEVSQDTPVVVTKSGRTEAGASAAASHTGAIAGSEAAYDAAFERAGVLRANSTQELFDAAAILAGQPVPETESVAIISNAGGPGVMTTDAVGDSSLTLASFADETKERLVEKLPDGANVYNPVDVIGDANVDRFERALEIVLEDPNVGMAVVLSCPTATLSFENLADSVVEIQDRYEQPVAATLMGGDSTREAAETLSDAGIPTYFDPARAVGSLETLARYGRVRDRTVQDPARFDVDTERAREVLAKAARRDTNRLGVEAMDLLEAYGISTPAGAIVDSPAEAEEVAADIGEEVVMKVVSPDILHKSDIGGVEVGVTQDDIRDTYEDLLARARNYQPDATILGVQVQEMLDLDAGVETIVGSTRDPQFGPLVLFGLGGIFVEIMEDTTERLAPVSESEAREMVDGIKASPLLYGARGRDPVAVDSLVDLIQRLSQLVTDLPAINELDVNPALVTPDGATAVDLRLTIDQEEL
ncbi:acetate--CoA ligase family protein [Halobacteriales archaeon Cl-PHB]